MRSLNAPSRIALAVSALALTLPWAVAPAQAASSGTLTFVPAVGTVDEAPTLRTSGPCPTSATATQAKIFGPGFSVLGQNMTAIAPGTMSKSHAFSVDSVYTLRDLAAIPYPPVTYKGTYTVVLICRQRTKPEPLYQFVGKLTFDAAGAYSSASGGAVPATPAPGHLPTPIPTVAPVTATPKVPTASPKVPSASPTASVSASPSPSPTATGTTASDSSNGSGMSPIVTLLLGLVIGAVIVGGFVIVRNRMNRNTN